MSLSVATSLALIVRYNVLSSLKGGSGFVGVLVTIVRYASDVGHLGTLSAYFDLLDGGTYPCAAERLP